MSARSWYRIAQNATDPSVAEIDVFDFIGDWIDDWIGWGGVTTAKTFGEALSALPDSVKTIRVHINSPGGDVFSAVTIANLLRDQQRTKGRTVETIVDGLAASAASIIAMGGGTVTMADNALMMIHNPWTVAIGAASEMRKAADELDTIRASIIATYQWHSELGEDDIATMMDDETWMDASEAIALGFATDIVEGLKAAASIDRRMLAKLKIPEQYRARVESLMKTDTKTDATPQPKAAASAGDVLRLCREGDCLDLAEGLIAASTTLEDVTAKVTAEKTTRAQATARATEIRSLCDKAKLPDLAYGYIKGSMSLEDVKAHLTTLTAKLDKAEIDAGLSPDQGQQATADGWKQAFAKTKRTGLGM